MGQQVQVPHQTSFVFLRGQLVRAPQLKGETAATLLVCQAGRPDDKILVKVNGRARVETIQGWGRGDAVTILGTLESHFDTRHRAHLTFVQATLITRADDDTGADWEKFGLPVILAKAYSEIVR